MNDLATIRQKLDEKYRKTRKDRIIFSITTVLLTPALMAFMMVVIWMIALQATRPRTHARRRINLFDLTPHPNTEILFVMLLTFIFGAILVSFFAIRKRNRRVSGKYVLGVVGSCAAFFGMAFLAFGTSLWKTDPTMFYGVFFGLGFVMLALLGRNYVMADNDPSMKDSSGDHSGGAFMSVFISIPALIFRSFGEILGSTSLIKGLTHQELEMMSRYLHALAGGDVSHAQRLLKNVNEDSAAQIMGAITNMKLIKASPDGPRLTRDGQNIVGIVPPMYG